MKIIETKKKKTLIVRGDEWISGASNLHKVITDIKRLEEDKGELIRKLRAMSKERDSKGGGFEFKKIEKVGAIRYSLIPELKEMDLEGYRGKDVMYWKLHKKF